VRGDERGGEWGVGSGEWGVNWGVGSGGGWEVDGMGVSEERARMVSMVDFEFRCIKVSLV
jgi:hypothetical protein